MGHLGDHRIRLMLVGTAISAGLLAGPAAGSSLAAVQTHAASTGVPVRADVLPLQNSNNCQVGGHAPCWAVTKNGAVLYLHSGGSLPLGNVVVDITCYYLGNPVVNGDNVEDHISTFLSTDGHAHQVSGHVPDATMDLGGHNPWDDGIPVC